MRQQSNELAEDASFKKLSSSLAGAAKKCKALPLEPLLSSIRRFAAVRRREVRLARLENAERGDIAQWRSKRSEIAGAVTDFEEAIKLLAEHVGAVRPLITTELDEVVRLARDDHPLRRNLYDAASSMGFSADEAQWLFQQLEALDYAPVKALCGNGPEDLTALLSGSSAGENGLLMAGFVRFTGDVEVDGRLQSLVLRLSAAGATASVFLALVIVVAANHVAMSNAKG